MHREIEAFLVEKCSKVPHSGRSLLKHLQGTHDMLRQIGAPEHVCLAGLFHSIYGTNIFKHQSVSTSERDKIKALIGEDAERLAYIFCTTERPVAFVRAAVEGSPYDVPHRKIGGTFHLTDREMYDLLTIEVANLTEQNAATPMVEQVRRAWLNVKGVVHAA